MALHTRLRPFWWDGDGLTYIDQRRLPDDIVYAYAGDADAVIDAVANGAIAGPRCAALFAAFGLVLARRRSTLFERETERLSALARTFGLSTEPLERVRTAAAGNELAQALAAVEENEGLDRSIAIHGGGLLPPGGDILTHGCTGALSTAGSGTAVGAIISAHGSASAGRTYVAETRPLLTGSRLAAFELAHAGIACTIIPDGAVATLMRRRPIAAVIVSAVAMAANGDALGELGTYGIAVAAAHHRVPFYIALPRASIDASTARGESLALASAALALTSSALADSESVWDADPTAPGESTPGRYFDLTPGHLISAIITEYGVSRQPYYESLPTLASRPRFAFIPPIAARSEPRNHT